MSEVWFTADTHFGHANILKYQPARAAEWSSVEEMNQGLADAWNSVVSKKDLVWHLGDFAMGDLDESLKWFHRLNGRKCLVRGNHDGPKTLRLPWSDVSDLKMFKFRPLKVRAVLCHYPLLSWNGAHRGVWMLHGHCHGMLSPEFGGSTRLDVGVDCSSGFRPFGLDELDAVMSDRVFRVVDNHI